MHAPPAPLKFRGSFIKSKNPQWAQSSNQVLRLTASRLLQETDPICLWALLVSCHGDRPYETISIHSWPKGITGKKGIGWGGCVGVQQGGVQGGGGCIGKTTSHLRRDPAQWEQVRCHLNSVISSAWWSTITGVHFTTWATMSLYAALQ